MSLYLQRGVGLLCFLYSLNCRVEFFSETRPPTTVILGNPVSDKRASRKLISATADSRKLAIRQAPEKVLLGNRPFGCSKLC